MLQQNDQKILDQTKLLMVSLISARKFNIYTVEASVVHASMN